LGLENRRVAIAVVVAAAVVAAEFNSQYNPA
jgi:hypothetical protein